MRALGREEGKGRGADRQGNADVVRHAVTERWRTWPTRGNVWRRGLNPCLFWPVPSLPLHFVTERRRALNQSP
jgi:hypothetical protein